MVAPAWRSPTVTTLRKGLLPDFRRERRSMQSCNSRSYPRNSDKISLSRAPTTIYIILPFRWFLFLIDRERRSMQQCNSRSYPRNSDKISLSRAQNTSLRHFAVSQVSVIDFDGTRIPRRGCARQKSGCQAERVPGGAPYKNNTNQDGKSRFVLFFARDFFGMIVRFE